MAEVPRANINLKSIGNFAPMGASDPKFQIEGVAPIKHFSVRKLV